MFDKNKPIIGVDIGNVISKIDTDEGGRKSYLQHQIKGAFDGVRTLHQIFEGQICLISKCGVITQVRTREWLAKSLFFETTGVNPNYVFFCEERKQKGLICDYLGVTHFIDDRLEVLGYLKTVPNKFLFSPSEREIAKNVEHLKDVMRVENWEELLKVIR